VQPPDGAGGGATGAEPGMAGESGGGTNWGILGYNYFIIIYYNYSLLGYNNFCVVKIISPKLTNFASEKCYKNLLNWKAYLD